MKTIEFGLPNGAGGMAAMQSAGYLRTALSKWSTAHNVKLITSVARHDHRAWLTVSFAQERDFTLFVLSFTYDSFMGWQSVA